MFRDGTSRSRCGHLAAALAVATIVVALAPARISAIELINVNINPFGSSTPFSLAAVANQAVASASFGTNRQLHIVDPLDPINGSTEIVVNPVLSAFPNDITNVNNLAVFGATVASEIGLYVADPLNPGAGATEIDVNPSGSSHPAWIADVASLAVFRATRNTDVEVFVADPLNPGAGATIIEVNPGGSSNPTDITDVASRAVFAATNNGTDTELFVADPLNPGAGATEIEINPGGSSNPNDITAVTGRAVLVAFDGVDKELYVADPLNPGAGATKVDILPGPAHSNPGDITAVSGLAVLRATDNSGTELHILDPLNPGAGTTVVDIFPGDNADPASIADVAGLAVFAATDQIDRELFVVDPLNPTAPPKKIDINPDGNSNPEEVVNVAGRAIFRATDGTDEELYIVDPLFPEAGFVRVDINPSGSSSPTQITDVNGRAVFAAFDGSETEMFVLDFATGWKSASSGMWDNTSNWDGGVVPSSVDDAIVAPINGLTVQGPAADTTVSSLTVGAKSGVATLAVGEGTITAHTVTIETTGRLAGSGTIVTDTGMVTNFGTIDLIDGLQINGDPVENHGLVFGGDGEISAMLNNTADGEVRASSGQRALFTGANNMNLGEISLLGGTVEFTQDLHNQRNGMNNGFVTGRGTIIVGGELLNDGNMGFSGGLSDIFGDVDNTAQGLIVNAGVSVLTFFDDVINNGEIRTSAGSTTVFFGSFSGAGTTTGTGTVQMEGDLSPGNSAALVTFETDLVFGEDSSLTVELGGTTRGTQYDALDVGGMATLNGTLQVLLADAGDGLFQPKGGETFSLLTAAGGIEGAFDDTVLPALPSWLDWQITQSTGELSLTVALTGDFNSDGAVNAMDYLVWRDSLGSTTDLQADANGDNTVGAEDYAIWSAHFGRNVNTGTGSGTHVPESSTAGLLLVAILRLAGGRPGTRRTTAYARQKPPGIAHFSG